MKQRIRVVGIIRGPEGVLILKHSRGRDEAPVFWELPTGKIDFGEQPEEAMTRAVKEATGLTATSVKIRDAITFMGLEGASRLDNLYIAYDVGVAADAKPVPSGHYTAYKYLKDFSNSGLRFNEATTMALAMVEGAPVASHASPRDTAHSVSVFTDGASRGNPGPSGIGYIIRDPSGQIVERGGQFIGFSTSRVAEYHALRKGVERAAELGIKSARFYSDSLMVVGQMNNLFPVKNPDVVYIHDAIADLLKKFDSYSFTHISREQNLLADSEANKAIDSIMKK